MDIFRTAWKNVFRDTRRTTLNVIALTIGIAIMMICIGWARGYFTTLYAGIQNLETGNIQVLNDEYLDQEIRLPLDLSVENYSAVRDRLLSLPPVLEAAGRIDFNAKFSFQGKSVTTLCRGIDPGPESKVTIISRNIEKGSYFDNGQGILVGKSLAAKLGLKAGDTLFARVRDAWGAENFIELRVSGIYFLGYPVMDDNIVFMDYKSASSLLRMENSVSRIVIKLKKGYSLDEAKKQIACVLTADLKAYPWQIFAQAMIKGVQSDIGSAFIMIGIIYFLIFLNILNTMSMSIRERTREIGTLRAIGMKKGVLTRMLLYEASSIAIIGGFLAVLIGGSICFYLENTGVDISPYMPDNMPFPFGQRFHADYRFYDYILSVVTGITTAVLGTIHPARRITRQKVAEAMRTV